MSSWQSWDFRLTSFPSAHRHPTTLEELQSAIASSPSIRVCGNSSHSYSPIAVAAEQGASISLERLYVVTVDQEEGTVTAEAGATVSSIHIALERAGRALPFTTALTTETIGGCVAAGTHGTGRRYGLLASLVVAGTLVLPDGSVATGTVANDPLIRASLVGLGLLGVWHSLTLRTVPLFQLVKRFNIIAAADFHEARLAEELLEQADSVTWFIFPATNSVKIFTRHVATPEDVAALPRSWTADGITVSTHVASCDVSYRALAFPPGAFDGARQTEAEFFLPQATAIDVARAYVDGIAEDDRGSFFLFGRYVAAGDHLLGPNQEDSVALTLVVPHVENKPDELRFNALHAPFEAVCLQAGGRPHWGKRSSCSREQVEAMYGDGFREFVRLRREIDPAGKFLNDFTRDLFE